MNHFISLKYFSANQIQDLINLAMRIKAAPLDSKSSLAGKSVGLIFEKSSLRTKTAFYLGALQLGAYAVYYSPDEVKLGQRESISDVARTLSGYLDAVVLRTYSHSSILEFAQASSVPVINGLSDFLHPSQALADILTIQELKENIKKVKVVYIGDGNNVCNSLIYAFSILGGKLTLAIPQDYLPSVDVLNEAKDYAKISGSEIEIADSIEEAASGADVLYTDVWISMGNEAELRERKKAFKNYQINGKILQLAKEDVIVMHCLPAHRGEEITDSVIESKNSVVFKQAQNRLYTAKAILSYILKEWAK